MRRTKGSRPSPATVISIVALILAVTGTAVAGVATVSVLSKKEKKQTRNIARDEINKAAPGLSVAKASNTDKATDADTVGGQRVVPFTYRSDSTDAFTTVATVGGLEVQTSCGSGDNDLYLFNRSGGAAQIAFSNVDDAPDNTDGGEGVVANDASLSVSGGEPDDDGVNGQAGFFTDAGRSVRVFYTLDEVQFGFDCSISGVVIG